ncbi:cobalamin biosynthesis protein CbiX [Thalassobius vesicularis]|uniref:Cobalamin biosynthesis protein CbiX n=1 Tax=Thalassobius vesicularis TaxID=1294297 RepID=A0A4S3MCI8_9RHOB|nr:cobalamin biosynthesis protein CbiX [Thalassobius vesicularis]THD76272.1 cobalamin biosynthesis protein CbiX [Thalassobius vesicularis]
MTQSALIVAHGSPSDPAPQEAALQGLAARVQSLLPGWQIRGATLAADGAVDAALAQLDQPLIYPFFMAQGYFTNRVLAPRSKALGLTQMAPFGVEPALSDCVAAMLTDTLTAQGWQAPDTALLLAAHGSAVSRTSANSTRAMEEELAQRLPFRTTRSGFIEEPPHVADQARDLGQAICLCFFALNAGHMLDDMPQALEEAGFTGPVLPPMIDWPQVPQLIANSLQAA